MPLGSEKRPNPDRHRDGSRTVTLRLDRETYARLEVAMASPHAARPHQSVSSYIKWLIETQVLRPR